MIKLTLPGLAGGAQYTVHGMTSVAVQPSQNVPKQYEISSVASVATGPYVSTSAPNISVSVAIS